VQKTDLDKILQKRGYAIAPNFRKPTVRPATIDKGEVSDVEPRIGLQSIPKEGPTLRYSGKCAILIKVYRRRLTDPLGDCEKYYIDSLRYAGLIRDDTYSEVSVTKEATIKVETLEEERVELTLTYEGIDPDNLWEKKT